jgi:predicted ATPase/DNA-binding CsgD family transcriptional regulator
VRWERTPHRLASTMSSLLVGRDVAVNEVLTALSRVDEQGRPAERLITLQGPPGIGKTRMAVEVLAAVAKLGRRTAFAYLVGVDGGQQDPWEYGEVPDLENIARAVQAALGVTHISSADPVAVLVSHLDGDAEHEGPLLVLDNCERIRAAVGDLVAILLDVSPGLQVLATSRAELGLPVERLIPLRPLSLPGNEDDDTASEAMALLLHLVRTGGGTIPPDQWPQARALVRWSGGLPLVLEFIAARLRSGLPPDTVLRRLDGGGLLTTQGTRRRAQPHQRTLRQVLDDSLELCLDAERTLFLRTACFANGFELDDAEVVCAGNGIASERVLDLLCGLKEKALLTVDAGTGRYGMLPPIAEYAERKLRERGEEDQVRRAHAEHFARLARDAADTWLAGSRGKGELAWLATIGRELDNLRAAMTWLRDHGSPETALEIALNLARVRFWWFSGLLPEGNNLLRRLLDACLPAPSPLRVAATAMSGWMALCRGDQQEARAARDHCRELVAALGTADEPPSFVDFLEGTYALLSDADAATALPLLRRAVAKLTAQVAAGLPADGDRHQMHMILGLTAGLIGDDKDEADRTSSAVLAEAREADAPWAASWARWNKGLVPLLFNGDPEEALEHFQASLRIQVEIGDQWGTVWSGTAICWALARATANRRAAVLQGAATRQQDRAGSVTTALKPFRLQTDIARQMVVSHIGPQIFDEEFQRGRAMRTEEAYALALRPLLDTRPPTPVRGTDQTLDVLTPAEAQIARMVAEGLRTNDIAKRTGRSARTVNTHITHIYQKVGNVNSRSELAMWVQRLRLGREEA